MPFTPFHFGPGLLAKSIVPRSFSFLAFVATQVVIDFETLFNIVTGRRPLHRFLHSIPGSLLAGLAVAGAMTLLLRGLRERLQGRPWLAAELGPRGALAGGSFGGVSHAILDNILHRDARLLYPLPPRGDELHGLLGFEALHQGCILAGALGIGILLARAAARR